MPTTPAITKESVDSNREYSLRLKKSVELLIGESRLNFFATRDYNVRGDILLQLWDNVDPNSLKIVSLPPIQ